MRNLIDVLKLNESADEKYPMKDVFKKDDNAVIFFTDSDIDVRFNFKTKKDEVVEKGKVTNVDIVKVKKIVSADYGRYHGDTHTRLYCGENEDGDMLRFELHEHKGMWMGWLDSSYKKNYVGVDKGHYYAWILTTDLAKEVLSNNSGCYDFSEINVKDILKELNNL